MTLLKTAIAVAAAVFLCAASAFAQGQSGQQSAPADQSFSDAKLEAFVSAAAAVTPIIAEARKEMQAIQQDNGGDRKAAAKEQREVAQQMQSDIRTSVEDAPKISYEEYRAIAAKAQQDEEFRKKLQAMLQKEMANQSQGS